MLDENRSERAIIILDMINEYAHSNNACDASMADAIPYIQGELQYFRERMRQVLFCTTTIDPSEVGSTSNVIQQLGPRTGEIVIKKTRPNAFFETNLFSVLCGLKIKTITIVGAFSHNSVLTTTASALDYGFSVVVPETCIVQENAADHAAALRLIHRWLNK